jgi:hypothetical protein
MPRYDDRWAAYGDRWYDANGRLALGVTIDGQIVYGDQNAAQLTPVGGVAIWMYNKTGGVSVKGTLVTSGSAVFSVVTVTAGIPNCCGVVYDSGIADGGWIRVVTAGVADVLFADGQAPTIGYWCGSSETVNGRAEVRSTVPDNSGTGIVIHNREIGHVLQSKQAGTDVLARVVLHFN